jgi:hypothetical protein
MIFLSLKEERHNDFSYINDGLCDRLDLGKVVHSEAEAWPRQLVMVGILVCVTSFGIF